MLKILIDMNLSRQVAQDIRADGFECIHWSEVGKANDDDMELVYWARQNGAVLVSCDRDFGAILALSHSDSPSVVQIRRKDIYADAIVPVILYVLHECESVLEQGALVSVGQNRFRIRRLPLKP